MRICFVAKYPPIEGGVSAQTYWATRGLASRGHEVFVVTNADEVEDTYRIRLQPEDVAWLTPEFPNGGSVRVFGPEPYSRRMTHIPMSNPFVSKLAGMAAQVVETYACEVIVGSYFEPYGMAAMLAATWTHTSLLLHHAGSDLDRLMRLPELAAAYKPMLRAANGIITHPKLARRFLGMGARPESLLAAAPYGIPDLFTPDALPLSPEDIGLLADVTPPCGSFDPRLPTIGIYGKPGVLKGTFDLIAALGALCADGLEFNLLLLSGSARRAEVVTAITAAGLDERTWLLPFVPHWRVPSFICACTAVCFLERDFPIPIHGPMIAREVLSCGTCLVLSGEIHAKQGNRAELIDGDTIILVPDPKDRADLAKRLRVVIEDPAGAVAIGARGLLARHGLLAFEVFVDAWENLVTGAGYSGLGHGLGPIAERLDVVLPWARPLLGSSFDELVGDYAAANGALPAAGEFDDPALAASFCGFIADRVTGPVSDVARYENARLWTMRDDAGPGLAPVTNALRGAEPTAEAVRGLYPFRRVPVRVERFDHDVTSVLCHSGLPETTDVQAIARQPIVIGFARMPNLSPTEVRLNDATLRRSRAHVRRRSRRLRVGRDTSRSPCPRVPIAPPPSPIPAKDSSCWRTSPTTSRCLGTR